MPYLTAHLYVYIHMPDGRSMKRWPAIMHLMRSKFLIWTTPHALVRLTSPNLRLSLHTQLLPSASNYPLLLTHWQIRQFQHGIFTPEGFVNLLHVCSAPARLRAQALVATLRRHLYGNASTYCSCQLIDLFERTTSTTPPFNWPSRTVLVDSTLRKSCLRHGRSERHFVKQAGQTWQEKEAQH